MKVTRVKLVEKTVTEDITPEEIVDQIIDSIDFFAYNGTGIIQFKKMMKNIMK